MSKTTEEKLSVVIFQVGVILKRLTELEEKISAAEKQQDLDPVIRLLEHNLETIKGQK